jgi:hypothetical protein
MPQIIEMIDAIARKKGRDVLYLTFYPLSKSDSGHPVPDAPEVFKYKNNKTREEVIQWLEANGVAWQPCGPFDPGWIIMEGYCGDIYLDVPFDQNNEDFQKLTAYLENPDGSMKIQNVTFWALPLERAMINKHQDEPGYWDRFWGDGDKAENPEKS